MFKSYFWVLHLAMIAFGTYFLADMANLIVGSRLEASVSLPKAEGRDLSSVALEGGNRDYHSIIEGNIFNSKLRGKRPEAEKPTQLLLEVSVPLPPLHLTLIGTIVGKDVVSYAVIEDPKTREQLLYRVGDLLAEDAKIVQIGRNKVVIRRGNEKEVLESFLVPQESKGSGQPVQATTVPASPVTTPGSGIRQVSKDRWIMDRREIEGAVDNLPQLLTKARIIPNFRDGKPDGFRIFAIVEGSLYSKIGLQNGDILHRVNGIEVKDPQNFLKVFEQLKDESNITIDLVRNNQKETFSYEIR